MQIVNKAAPFSVIDCILNLLKYCLFDFTHVIFPPPPPKHLYLTYDSKLHLMMSFMFWGVRECGVISLLLLLTSLLWPGVAVTVIVLSRFK